MSEEYAELKLTESGLQVEGEGSIESAMTPEIIEAILKLPPTGDFSIKSIVDRFSMRTKRSFDSIIRLDTKLREAYNNVTAGPVGHKVDPKDVADEVVFGIQPIAVVIFTTDGRRFVARETRKYDSLETIEDFENRSGLSVLDWVKKDINKIVEKGKRLSTLLESEPVEYIVNVVRTEGDHNKSLITSSESIDDKIKEVENGKIGDNKIKELVKKFHEDINAGKKREELEKKLVKDISACEKIAIETMKITAYSEDQVYLYAQRHNFHVMNISISKKK